MRGEALLHALHLGWKVDHRERMGQVAHQPSRGAGKTPGHAEGLCWLHQERAPQGFAESGDHGDGGVTMTIPWPWDFSEDSTPHAVCLLALLTLSKLHCSEQGGTTHRPLSLGTGNQRSRVDPPSALQLQPKVLWSQAARV